jgi:hypothetical protein
MPGVLALGHETPLVARGEAGSAAAAQMGIVDGFDCVWRGQAVESLAQGLVTAGRFVGVDVEGFFPKVNVLCQGPFRHTIIPKIQSTGFVHTFSGCRQSRAF